MGIIFALKFFNRIFKAMTDDNRVRIVIFTFLVTFCKGYNPHLSVQLNPCEAEVLRVSFIYFYLSNVKHILLKLLYPKPFTNK